MTPDDVTQPLTQRPAPHAAWPPYAPPQAPTRQMGQPRQPRPRRGLLWGIAGFIVGCTLTTLLALMLLAPQPAPNTQAQTTGAALTVTLTDTLLSQSLGSNLGTGAVTLTQPRAYIQANGQIVVSGVLQGGALASGSAVTIVTQPYVSQNTLAIRVLRASVGGIALPTLALDALRDQINQQLAQSSHISLGVGQALVVSGVSFANGTMTLTYAPANG